MALLYCSECGNPIAENTQSCNCHALSKYSGKNGRAFTTAIILLLLASMAFFFAMPGRFAKDPAGQALIKK